MYGKIVAEGKMQPKLKQALQHAQSMEEVEILVSNIVKVAKMAGRIRWPSTKLAVYSKHQIFSSLSVLN